MSVKPVTFYKVECDEPGCEVATGELCDYAAWADEAHAVDDWTEHDGIVLDDGRAFCEPHSRAHFCDECDEIKPCGCEVTA